MYIGRVAFAPGRWIGIQLDEPWGDHDGAVGGRRYFTCRPGHGIFVRSDECERSEAQGGQLHQHFRDRDLRRTEKQVKHSLSVKAHMLVGAAEPLPRAHRGAQEDPALADHLEQRGTKGDPNVGTMVGKSNKGRATNMRWLG